MKRAPCYDPAALQPGVPACSGCRRTASDSLKGPRVDAHAPIALYDSGLGGLSVVREGFARLPGEAVTYFGDTARAPYGPRPAAEILAFTREILDLLVGAGAKLVVIACNTSSALALPALRADCPVPLIGLIDAGAEA